MKKSAGEASLKLRERVKELSCLYAIAQVSGRPSASLAEILQGVADSLPPAWQRPESALACVVLDDAEFFSGTVRDRGSELAVPVFVRGEKRGLVSIGYPSEDAGFLQEEKQLLEEVARQVGLIVDRRETAAEQERLHTKLRHADRLSTIGQLAAGVAHELNEPLGGILGFAQLLEKRTDLSDEARTDLAKIESAALHARDIIRQLMTFARQTPACDVLVDVNRLIRNSEVIWGPRCAESGVQVEYVPGLDLPEIVADDRQLQQVVTNLVVNAVQAMPDGGILRIETARENRWILLVVRDNGMGIPKEVFPRIFDPFFTTKDVDEGNGLGLSVVHGIVTGHGGTIAVDSVPGQGTAVTVRLPVHRLP
ncbi:MAG: sensor histidine kinase [Kiritimatiellales bacterium]